MHLTVPNIEMGGVNRGKLVSPQHWSCIFRFSCNSQVLFPGINSDLNVLMESNEFVKDESSIDGSYNNDTTFVESIPDSLFKK